jgi:hypothetical protein
MRNKIIQLFKNKNIKSDQVNTFIKDNNDDIF